MKTINFPKITTVVQAKPWAEGHVARFISTRAVSKATRPQRTITVSILPR